MAFNIANALQQNYPDAIGIDQLKRRNALAEQDQQMQMRQANNQNALAQAQLGQYARQNSLQDEALATQKQNEAHQAAYAWAQNLASIKDPGQFQQVAAQAAADPRVQALGIDISHITPENVQAFVAQSRGAAGQVPFEQTPEYQKIQATAAARSANGMPGDAPASVQEWMYYGNLSPAQKAAYLEMKRSQQTFLPTIAQVPTVVRPGVAGNPTEMQPLTTLPAVAGAAGTVAGAEAAGKATGEARATAQVDLASNLDDIQKMRANVKGLISTPGFGTIYGLSGKVDPRNYIAGTDAANAEARRSQLEAQGFGISIQKMRGLGQLSNAEGLKVSRAYTRAIDRSQSAEAAKQAWGEVLSYLDLAEKRAQQKAGAAPQDVSGVPSDIADLLKKHGSK